MAETVLLTGISGFIAKHVAARLLGAGYGVRGSLRSMARAEEVRVALGAPEALRFVALDLGRDEGWDQAMEGVDVLVHTASPFPIVQPKDADELIRPAVEGTERALRAAARAGVRRVVLTSSTAAVSHGGAGVMDETDWCDPDAEGVLAYTRSKTLAERRAWELAGELGLALTVINPGFVMGPPMDGHYGSSIGVVKRLMRGRDPMLPMIGFSVVDVRDVAEMHLRAVQRPELAGRRFLAVAGAMTMPDMGRVLKAAYPARRIPTRVAPKALLRLLALFDPQIRTILPSIGHIDRISNARATGEMGMKFISPEGALRASAEWLVKAGEV